MGSILLRVEGREGRWMGRWQQMPPRITPNGKGRNHTIIGRRKRGTEEGALQGKYPH